MGGSVGGFSVQTEVSPAVASVPSQPQTINVMMTRGADDGLGFGANDWNMMANAVPDALEKGSAVLGNTTAQGMSAILLDGKKAHSDDMGNFYINNTHVTDSTSYPLNSEDVLYDVGSVLEPNLVNISETKDGTTIKAPMSTRGEFANMSLQGSMGIASSPMSGGKHSVFPCSTPNSAKSTISISLIEGPSYNISARPTLEEVIAFGGIHKPSSVRTSKILGCHAC
jgi:hypothetical protein